ncbi:Oligopeptide transport system permease protein OppC [compost metagenome]
MKKALFLAALIFLGLLVMLTVTANWVLPHSSFEQNVDAILRSPDARYWMGTDSLGRDLFARILLGARVSLVIGVVTSTITLIIGFTYGAIAGWSEGWVDRLLMRSNDIFMAIPSFVTVSVLCLTLQMLLPFEDPQARAMVGLCVAISLTQWMSIARVTRGMVLEIRRKPFIEAAVALGASPGHILLKHVLPNIANTLLVLMALQIPATILYESFMSFIGLGIQPPYTSWGILVREGWKTLSDFPHLILFPSAILFLTVWSFHMVLDQFRNR